MCATKSKSKILSGYKAVCGAVIGVVLALIGPALAQTGEGAPTMASPFGVSLDQAVLNFLSQNNLPGATVAVTRRGRLVWSKGYGQADADAGTAMQPWHRSRIGSVSKFITAVGAMKLVESGKISLDSRIYSDPGPFVSLNAPWPGEMGTSGVLPNPSEYWRKMLEGVQNVYDTNFVNLEINKTIDWATQIRFKHILSHTSGMRRSDDIPGTAKYFNKDEKDLHYGEVHQYFLTAPNKAAPFQFEPETKAQYSNAAFALAGYVIGVAAGSNYQDYLRQQVLNPLGLTNVVPFNTEISQLDAKPHDAQGNPEDLDPDNPSWIRTSTGGWAASARDLVRLMCALDRKNNGTRVLSPATVTTMETAPVAKFAGQPVGWDWRSNDILSKNGKIGGGTALIRKYLPGAISDDEINVAIAINKAGTMPDALIQQIAEAAAKVYIPEDYDLFDAAQRCYDPPAKRFGITSVALVGFYPVGTSNPLPATIENKCPVTITLKGMFNHFGTGKVEYRFRFLVENRVSTTFSTVIKGDPKDPLYEQPTVFHNVPLPLPAAIKPPPQGGIPPGPGDFAVLEPAVDPLFPPGPKGPKGPGGKVVAPTGPGTGIKGTVRLEVLTPTGGLMSNPVHYHIVCEPEMAILSGTVQLRDDSPKAPACARPASVAASIRTNKPGPVDYVLACTGEERTWKGKTTAHQTAPNTFIGVAVHPIQIAKQEDVICFLRRGEQFGFSDVLATAKRPYPCKVTGVTTPDPVPPPPGPPGSFTQPEAPRFVCIGGRTVGRAPHQVCDCPPGHETRQTGPNRFQCVRAVVNLVCAGGRVAGTKFAPSCVCPAGQSAKQVAPNRFQCSVQLVCEGGRVVTRGQPPRSSCECPGGFVVQKVPPAIPASLRAIPGKAVAANDDDPDRFRCVRVSVPDKGGTRVPVR